MQKKIVLTTVLMLVVMALLATGVQANYQSKPTGKEPAERSTKWITGIRQMEADNQVMGLNEQIDTTTGLAETPANNIDVHMAKNTEYGAAVLLGASDYGKQGRRMDQGTTTTYGTDVKATTTGNVYGIYEIGYRGMNITYYASEHVAGGGTSYLSNIASKYVNRYESSAKPGDATNETAGWHESRNAEWLSSSGNSFGRGNYGAFSYNSSSSAYSYYARAAVVCGSGF